MGGQREGRSVDVVALVASAGGLEALTAVLKGLPTDLDAAVVVQQHLGAPGSQLAQILSRQTGHDVAWARDGQLLEPGRVVVTPARARLEVLPDGRCSVSRTDLDARDHPHDALLTSLADSYGPGALGVVLSGMGRDGAAGVRALKAAGGVLIAQSEDTAEQPSMPQAAAQAGVDLVLPLHEISGVVADVVRGAPLPRANDELDTVAATFGDEGVIAGLAREIDWSRHPLGPVLTWSPVLRSALRLAAAYPTPYTVLWGEELFHFYNDAGLATHGANHPRIFGVPVFEAYPEIREQLEPLWRGVLAGQTVHQTGMRVPMVRGEQLEDAWFELVYAPIRDVDGTVGGVASVWNERTDEVLGGRRLETLNRLATAPAAASRQDALHAALALLAHAADVPFAAGYLIDAGHGWASLVDAVGVPPGSAMAPRVVRLAPGSAWPLHQVVDSRRLLLVDDLTPRFPGHQVGPHRLAPKVAVLHPLRDEAEEQVAGVLILGASPRLRLDDRYLGFLTLVGETVSAKVAESHARDRERQRLVRLADLDRAKTEFFSNVSHEFRTPLTLMLGPLEEVLRRGDELPAGVAAELDVVHRNTRRLQRLVGTLLDFTQIEDGRLRATYAPADLAALTTETVSMFRSAAEAAGLKLTVDAPPLPEPVWVDAEMWEKVVSNLVSNALKFTWSGGVEVSLRALTKHAELVVQDTGVGIPAEHLPHVLKRFHRVPDSRGRTHEGAGIGLALVDELVRRHHGRIRITSEEGVGTTATVWIPLGRRLGHDLGKRRPPSVGQVAALMAEEATQWDPAREENEAALRLDDSGPSEAPAGVGSRRTGARRRRQRRHARLPDEAARLCRARHCRR